MAEHALCDREDQVFGSEPLLGPAVVSDTSDWRAVPTTLEDLIGALQDQTDDDQLILAVVNDLMGQGRLKKRLDA
jgi:hypothetical protein